MESQGEFSYLLVRKNVKNINLRVKPDGSVVVSANPSVPKKYIDDFVKSQISFIKKARMSMELNQNSACSRQFITGEQMPYLGKTLILQVEKADRCRVPEWIAEVQNGSITNFSRNNQGEAVYRKDGYLYFFTVNESDLLYKTELYDAWQKIQTGILCDQISRQYYPIFAKLGVAYPKISIRKMSSRWGSCIPGKQKVTFNSLLLEKPLDSVEYVVVHEFAHFIHPNHSNAFYQFIGQILPDWKNRKEKLHETI